MHPVVHGGAQSTAKLHIACSNVERLHPSLHTKDRGEETKAQKRVMRGMRKKVWERRKRRGRSLIDYSKTFSVFYLML